MKNYYFAVCDRIGSKDHSYVVKMGEGNDVLKFFDRFSKVYTDDDGNDHVVTERNVLLMETKKKAIETVNLWNLVSHKRDTDFYKWAYKHNCCAFV